MSILDTEKSDKVEVDVERKRIDSFVTLKDGSTTGDAELKDIRVGYNAKTYNTAGEAVREQMNEIVNNKLNTLPYFIADVRNGSVANIGNDYYVAINKIIDVQGYDEVIFRPVFDHIPDGYHIQYQYATYTNKAYIGKDSTNYPNSTPFTRYRFSDGFSISSNLKSEFRLKLMDEEVGVTFAVTFENNEGEYTSIRADDEYNAKVKVFRLKRTSESDNPTAYISNNHCIQLINNYYEDPQYSILYFEDSVNIFYNKKYKEFTKKDFQSLDNIKDFKEGNSTNDFSFSLKARDYLCYDAYTEKIVIKRYLDIERYHQYVPLIKLVFNQVVGGLLHPSVVKGEINNVNNKIKREINNVNNKIKGEIKAITEVKYISNLDSKIQTFSSVITSASDEIESFMYFTDPHILQHMDSWNTLLSDYIKSLTEIYRNSPVDFILCGGDWLQHQDTQEEASLKLGKLNGYIRDSFGDRFYPVIGNHDTNYQGVNASGEANKGRFSREGLKNILFSRFENMYYSFKGNNTRFYVFDTEIDWETQMNDYRWAQCNWFANQLKNNDDKHSVISVHIVSNQVKDDCETKGLQPLPFFAYITSIAKAYNRKTSTSVNGTTYDFSNTKGKVAFAIAGHAHYDYISIYNDIPVVITTNAAPFVYGGNSEVVSDLVCIDYGNKKATMVRIGSGTTRTCNIIV